MRNQQSKAFLILVSCIALFPMLGSVVFANETKAHVVSPTTFVKSVRNAGVLIDTIQTTDGSFVSLIQRSNGFLIRKVAASGQAKWERILQLQTKDRLSLYGIAQTSDGGYVLTGYAATCNHFYYYCYTSTFRALVIKLHPNGGFQWAKTFAESGAFIYFSSIVATPDNGFIVAGSVSSRLTLIQFTSAGDVLKTKAFDNLNPDDFFQLHSTINGQLILDASIPNGGSVLLKLDTSFNVIWSKTFQVASFSFRAVGVTPNNGVILSAACAGCNQLALVQLDSDGNVVWKAKYSFPVMRVHSIEGAISTADGGFAITGMSGGQTGQNAKPFLLKVNSAGIAIFQQSFTTGKVTAGNVFATPDNGFLIFRSSNPSLLISRVNSAGTVADCNLFASVPTTNVSFGQLKTSSFKAIEFSSSPSLGIGNVGGTSTTTHMSESVECP